MLKYGLILSLLLCAPLANAKIKDWANATYSNVKLLKGSGDLVGWRLQIIHSNLKYFILLQAFEGEPLSPCFAQAKIVQKTVKATLHEGCHYQGEFSAEIKNKKVLLELPSVKQNGIPTREKLQLIE
jgi:hypothetical protein